MFEYQNVVIDNLHASLEDLDTLKSMSIGLSAQLGLPEKSKIDPYMVKFNYTACVKKGFEPFFVLDIRIFFNGPDPDSVDINDEKISRTLLKEALRNLRKQLEIISNVLGINKLPCPEKF